MTPAFAEAGLKPDRGAVFTVFFVSWIALGICSFLFFQVSRNAKLKRSLWPVLVISTSIVFGCFVIYMTSPNRGILFIFIPAIVLIAILNLRGTRFCDACGKTLHSQLISRRKFCPFCGAVLQK